MANYATFELSEALTKLTVPQRIAIARIVEHVYLNNKPMADLFRGEGRICAETSYYRRGKLDEATGAWAVKPGWGHDERFQTALKMACRLALQTRTNEELASLASAKRKARLAAPDVVERLISISRAADKDAARVNAAKAVLDYATADTGESVNEETNEAEDWWKAAEG